MDKDHDDRRDLDRWRAIEQRFAGSDDDQEAERSSTNDPLGEPLGNRFGGLLESAASQRGHVHLNSGDSVGPYRVDGVLGEGGMGRVYLAHRADGTYQKKVALKLLQATGEDPAAVERFLRERQILAGLDHPHIARLIDGGLIDQTPYLVMEWIDGPTLVDFCEELQLEPEARLRLFIQVTAAMQHAHKNGIIHRDLKPSNVIVDRRTETPRVAVLDFGIALFEQDKTPFTMTGQVVGTPGYMSPEQACGDKGLDRRTDIFSMGVMLYEMLCGQRPFDGGDAKEILSALLHGRSVPLRTRLPQLPRDVETIVHKCIAHEMDDRYSSARALREDIERYLDGEPIAARPLNAIERALRIAKRRPRITTIVAASIIVAFISLLALVAASQRHAEELEIERNSAVSARADAESMLQFMVTDLYLNLDKLGRLDLLEDAARKTLEYYARRPALQSDEAMDGRSLALTNAGRVLEEQGQVLEALEAYQRNHSILTRLYEENPQPHWLLEVARSESAIASAWATHGDLAKALHWAQLAERNAFTIQQADHPASGWAEVYFDALSKSGWIQREAGNEVESLTVLNTALKFADTQELARDDRDDWRHRKAVAMSFVGMTHWHAGRLEQALQQFEGAREICQALVESDPANTRWLEELQLVQARVGSVWLDRGQPEQAMPALEEALSHAKILIATEPDHASWLRELSVAHSSIGWAYLEIGDTHRGGSHIRQSLEISRERARRFPANLSTKNDLAWDLLDYGQVQHDLGRPEQAVALWNEGLSIIRQTRDSELLSPYYLDTELQLLIALENLPEARKVAAELHEMGWNAADFLDLVQTHKLLSE